MASFTYGDDDYIFALHSDMNAEVVIIGFMTHKSTYRRRGLNILVTIFPHGIISFDLTTKLDA